MNLHGKTVILSSGSPRRRELLGSLDIDFTIDMRTSFKESYGPDVPAEQVPVMMAEGKSEGYYRELSKNEILITADTMVLCDGRIMGKPHHHSEAKEMLHFLSGKEHTVITAVTLRSKGHKETFSDSSTVTFKELTSEEIDYYVDKYRPFDKAGAYGVQEWIGLVGITRIDGSFYNVMGLPVHKVYEALQRFIAY